MKSRLSVSVSTLFSGKQRRFFSEKILICSSNMNMLNGKSQSFSSCQHHRFGAPRRAVINSYSEDDFSELGPPVVETQLKLVTEKPEPSLKTAPVGKAPVSSFQYEGFETLKRAVHNFSSEDDFSELGSPVAGSAITQLKLVTEKPQPFVKTDATGKASANRRRLTELFLGHDKTPQNSSGKFHNHHNVNWKNSLEVDDSSCSMSNGNILDGLDCCEVGSENSESSGRDLPNHALHTVKNVTIRIRGIAKETTDPMIHSLCKSTGVLEGFARAGTGSVDALFRVTNGTDAQGIVQRLNDTVIDGCHWSAYQIPKDSSRTTLSVSEVGSKLGIRINSRLVELKKQFDSRKVYFEDLQLLHMGILHLEGLPTISNSFSEDLF